MGEVAGVKDAGDVLPRVALNGATVGGVRGGGQVLAFDGLRWFAGDLPADVQVVISGVFPMDDFDGIGLAGDEVERDGSWVALLIKGVEGGASV